jgi:hypothetical protein
MQKPDINIYKNPTLFKKNISLFNAVKIGSHQPHEFMNLGVMELGASLRAGL